MHSQVYEGHVHLVVVHGQRRAVAVDSHPVGGRGYQLWDAAPLLVQGLQLAHHLKFDINTST